MWKSLWQKKCGYHYGRDGWKSEMPDKFGENISNKTEKQTFQWFKSLYQITDRHMDGRRTDKTFHKFELPLQYIQLHSVPQLFIE
jgi:hypothetical protein